MRPQIIAFTIASALAAFTTAGFAQTQGEKTFTHGESKRCESMSGEDKAQCDKEEGTKARGAGAQEAGGAQSSGGASAAAGRSGTSFTHGESRRCQSMTGTAKTQCDKEEANKTEGSAQPADRGTPATPAAGSPAGE